MRDINVCKNCQYFLENEVFPRMIVNEHSLVITETSKRYFYRRHNCMFEALSVRAGRMNMKTEYFNLGIPSECPYRVEHEMYEMNGEHGIVNYKFSRRFRRKRTCQHCGASIPNRRKCPNCGYESFEVYKPYNENAIIANACILVILFCLLFIRWYLNA